jgi:predicted DCC family thiol-disulfide oxidoreductase YuxK
MSGNNDLHIHPQILFCSNTFMANWLTRVVTSPKSFAGIASCKSKGVWSRHRRWKSGQQTKVWWDSECPLCEREISWMKALDSKHAIEFIAVQDPLAVCPIDKKLLMEKFHAQEPGKDIVSGAAAFAAMWRSLPPPFLWIGCLAEKYPMILEFLELTYVRRDHLTMDISNDEKRTDHTFVDSELSHWLHLSG